MTSFVFGDSWALWGLLPLFVIWTLFFLKRQGIFGGKPKGTAAIRYSSISPLRTLKPSRTILYRRGVQCFRLGAVLLLVLAAARPQSGRRRAEVKTEGIDIVLAVDTSGSMQALDLDADRSITKRRNRLQVASEVVTDFVEKRENDQVGLVVFGEQAFTQCPLTLDHGIVATFLSQLEIGMAGDGPAIGSAIGTAVKRLKKSEAKSKVIILLTDGRSNAGDLSPKKAAEIAETFGIRIYTIAAGTRGKAPFLVKTLFGMQPQYQAVEIDEAGLKEIAEITGGAYFRAEDLKALESIYDQIDALETTEITNTAYLEYDEKFEVFVAPALLLLLMEILLLGTRLRKVP